MRRSLGPLASALLALIALATAGCKGKPKPTYTDAMVGALREGKATQARGDMQTIAIGITQFVSNDGNLTDVGDMDSLVAALQPTWVRVVRRTDPWDRSYNFSSTGDSWMLSTAGVDGTPGNADDLIMRDGQIVQMPKSFNPTGNP